MSKKPFLIIGILLIVIAVPLVKQVTGSGNLKEVEVEILTAQSIQSSVIASGKLIHEKNALLSTEEIGKVKAIYVKEGEQVNEGQLLLQIDDEAHKAAVEQNHASVQLEKIAIKRQQLYIDNLRKQWQRNQQLYQRDLLDQNNFDLATNELELAEVDLTSSRQSLVQSQALLEQAKNRLNKTRVYSPMDGVVTSMDIKVGETAISGTINIPGSSLMTIANPSSIHTEVNVDEADIAHVAIGQTAKVYVIAYPDQPIYGVVDSIAVSAKVAEGTQNLSFAIKIKFTDVGSIILRPGMSCRAEIYTANKEQTLAVPIQALLIEEDRTLNTTNHYVFINQDGKAKKIAVKVGLSDDRYQEIREGLNGGEAVVISPDKTLKHLNEGDLLEGKAARDTNGTD